MAEPQLASRGSALRIAWPASLAAIVTPLLGLIDTAVLARGADTQALAGASLAGAVFSLLYWSFGFLRMSLSGLSAQALGADDEARLRGHLLQGTAFGLLIGCLLLALGGPIAAGAQALMVDSSNASAGAGEAMRTYLGIRLWAAPAVITTTAILGWLTGQGRTLFLMLVTIGTAAINAVLSIWLVLGLDQGIAGLALATAIAEVCGLLLAMGSAAHVLARRGGIFSGWSVAAARQGLGAVLSLNRDIVIRTLLLDLVFLSFARFGAGFGDLTVAANHVLLNLVLTTTLLLDGPAIAAETFVGQALGADTRRRELFDAAWKRTGEIAIAMAVFLLVVLAVLGGPLLALTIGDGPNNQALIAEARRFLPWAVVMPLAVGVAYHLDGVYIGATRGAALRNTMAGATALYFATAFVLTDALGNHGLWLAFLLFMAARGLGLVLVWPRFRPMLATPRPA